METGKAIKRIALKNKLSAKQVRADMIAAIHVAYLADRSKFQRIFGDHEPLPEEFMEAMARKAIETENQIQKR